ncbi:MAG: exosortase/archaeosortase family protein [Bacteroidales bacterium]|jgi:exosortase/archaeosortase family protein|nr:exosortase/archaeosortase family protein [Bacteroidales bacterium]
MGIKQRLQNIWAIEDNRNIIKDGAIFGIVTIIFHFLYWNTNMNLWLFGPFTTEVFDFFTNIAYQGTKILLENFSDYPFISEGMQFKYYDELGVYATITIIHDCSAIKQCMQFLLVMAFCPNKWYKRLVYFLIGSVIILFCNIIRCYLLSDVLAAGGDFDYMHDWVARPLMYVVIFALWFVWIEFFARKKKKSKNEKLEESH